MFIRSEKGQSHIKGGDIYWHGIVIVIRLRNPRYCGGGIEKYPFSYAELNFKICSTEKPQGILLSHLNG